MGGEGNLPAEEIGRLDGSPVRPPNLAREIQMSWREREQAVLTKVHSLLRLMSQS